MPYDDQLGEVLRDGERIGLRYVREFAHPIERVWRALTESEQLRHWMPCDIVGERRAGAKLELPFWPENVEGYHLEDDPVLYGEIEVWDPPRRFDWTWDGDRLSFVLAETVTGTRLEFTTWLGEPDPDGAASAASGYHVCFEALRALLEGRPGPSIEEADRWAEQLGPAYTAAVAGD